MQINREAAITDVSGITAGAVHAGIKKDRHSLDLAIIASDRPAAAAATMTRNQVRAAPVLVSEENLRSGTLRAIVVNAGNANCCTGARGLTDARRMVAATAAKLGVRPSEVAVASTGVIGVHLPIERVEAGIAAVTLTDRGGAAAAHAILTTDTRVKMAGATINVGGQSITIAGMAKGSGMIHPNMATMLAFVATDARIASPLLAEMLARVTDRSFNQMTVDGDTSTNDCFFLLANGAAGAGELEPDSQDAAAFEDALLAVAADLAQAIARDGEGATKFIEMRVLGAASDADARIAAKAVVASSLVKTAIYGADPNWGRILCAMGYSGARVEEARVDLRIGDVWLMRRGDIQTFDRADGVAALAGPDVVIEANLNLGPGRGIAWGCDLTEQYIEINGKYTT